MPEQADLGKNRQILGFFREIERASYRVIERGQEEKGDWKIRRVWTAGAHPEEQKTEEQIVRIQCGAKGRANGRRTVFLRGRRPRTQDTVGRTLPGGFEGMVDDSAEKGRELGVAFAGTGERVDGCLRVGVLAACVGYLGVITCAEVVLTC